MPFGVFFEVVRIVHDFETFSTNRFRDERLKNE